VCTNFFILSRFWTIDAKFDTCCQRYVATCGKFFLYRCTSTVSALNYCSRIFFKTLSYLYVVVRTNFSADFLVFAIFDRNFAKIVAQPSNENENYVVLLKEQSLQKKTLKTTSKSGNKRQRNACSNYATLERMVLRTQSVTNKKQTNKQTPHLRTYRRRALCDLLQTLHGDRARRAHQKRCYPFFDPTYTFSYRVYGKIWPNLPTHGFSTITP